MALSRLLLHDDPVVPFGFAMIDSLHSVTGHDDIHVRELQSHYEPLESPLQLPSYEGAISHSPWHRLRRTRVDAAVPV